MTNCGMPYYASVEDVLSRHSGTFDVVYLHRGEIADRYLPLVRRHCPQAKVVYGVADLHHVRLARQANVEQRPELLSQSRRVADIEMAAARRADIVLTHSPAEATLLARAAGAHKVHVVSFATEARPRGRRFANRHGLMFVGGFNHAPNADAVHHLLRDIMPLVWAVDDTITCKLVGQGWRAGVLPGLDPRVQILGTVDDLNSVLGTVRLSVAPLRFGAGIKGKVLDSFAAGLPCAMTPVAAEGLPLSGLLPALVADCAEALAQTILWLHGDQRLNEQAGEEAAQLSATVFGQDRVTDCLGTALGCVRAPFLTITTLQGEAVRQMTG